MKDYELLARKNQLRANEILRDLDLIKYWESHGCRANIIGSLAMGLLVRHLDIDLHVYSSDITEEKSFAIVAGLAKNPCIKDIRCINGLHTDEHCIAWHLTYEDSDRQLWQIDIIHIESGTRYDGFFETQARRIVEVLSAEHRDTILRLKYLTPEPEAIHGIEYYQAVIESGVRDLHELKEWVKRHRSANTASYWTPA